MSTALMNPTPSKPHSECARLIPGEVPASRPALKKPSRSVGLLHLASIEPSHSPVTASPEGLLNLLLPRPLRGWAAWEWLRSVATDCAFITLDWLIIGVLLLPIRILFAGSRLFASVGPSSVFLLGISLLHGALITLVGYTEGLYSAGRDLRSQAEAMGKAAVWSSLVLCFAYGLQGAPWTISVLICAASALHVGVLWVWRWWSIRHEHSGSEEGEARNVLIVGAGRVGRRIASSIERHPGSGRRIFGFLDDERPLGSDIIGRITDLAMIARKGFVDEVILAAPPDDEQTFRLIREVKRLRLDLEIIPELFGCDPAGQEVEHIGGLPAICVHAERLPMASLVLKRIIDVVGAGLGLIVLSPLLVVIAFLIVVDSPGQVLYVAQRAGRKGRLFRCYKFRTMANDADQRKDLLRQRNERSGPTFKIFDDPRVTRVGRFLRRYSLDELPQLWNVVKGEMSLVGPRPHPLDDYAAYELSHLGRLDVTPGLTGLWQVSARCDPSFDRAIELDREYIRTWSLELDLRILLRTVLAVMWGSGT